MPRKQSSHDILQHATINHYKQLLRVTRVTHVEQEPLTLPGLLSSPQSFSGVRVARSLVDMKERFCLTQSDMVAISVQYSTQKSKFCNNNYTFLSCPTISLKRTFIS
jgi:hypothetical protein